MKEISTPLFVYGTLKAGFGLHDVLGGSPFLHTAKVKGFKMFSLGGYPCVVRDENAGTISGEVYQVSKDLFKVLDGIERMYDRLPFFTTKGDMVELYVWKYTTNNLKEVPGGVWK